MLIFSVVNQLVGRDRWARRERSNGAPSGRALPLSVAC